MIEGFAEVTMPGRFEVLGRQPLVIVDGAHNSVGADTCASVFFGDFHPDGRRILVVGTTRDAMEMLSALRADEFDIVFVATAPTPRAVPAGDLAAAAEELGCDHVVAFDDVESACRRALEYADGDDAILVTGSLYTAGAAAPPSNARQLTLDSGSDPGRVGRLSPRGRASGVRDDHVAVNPRRRRYGTLEEQDRSVGRGPSDGDRT